MLLKITVHTPLKRKKRKHVPLLLFDSSFLGDFRAAALMLANIKLLAGL